MARSLTTTDHDTIRRWAEDRGGKPSEVVSTASEGGVGIIRIDFPGYSGEGKLQELSWDDWFRKFDEASLAFVYEEETADGQRSSFNELVGRETAEARAEGEKTNRRTLRAVGRAPGGKAAPRGRRQAARTEAARTTRPRKVSRSSKAGAASRGSSARGRKRATGGRGGARMTSGAKKGGGARARKRR
jgi:hypothetical protein